MFYVTWCRRKGIKPGTSGELGTQAERRTALSDVRAEISAQRQEPTSRNSLNFVSQPPVWAS